MARSAGRQTGIWIVSSEQWPRALLRAELIELGYDAIGFLTLDEALAALMQHDLERPKSLILDLTGQTLSHAQLVRLAEEKIPTVLLGGAVEFKDSELSRFVSVGVLKRPYRIEEVTAMVKRFVSTPVDE